jgi:6-phosphogluconolactonase
MRDLYRHTAVPAVVLAAMLVACWPASSWGQQVIYTNNDESPSNTISALAVNPADGSLVALPGSPFSTGGSGSFAPNIGGVNVLALSRFLYATNSNPLVTNGGSVAAFSINDDGTLATVPGSPFPTLGSKPNGIAVSNDGTLLFVTNLDAAAGTVSVFQIAPNGSLTLVGSPLAVAAQPLGVVLDSPDSLLFISHFNTNAVGVYTVGTGGSSLTPVAGSPFGAGGGERGLDVNAAHTFLYVADGSNNTVSGFSIGGGGILSAVPGSPFSAGSEPTGVLLHPTLSVLYVSNDVSNDIIAYSFDGSGTLTQIQDAASGGDGTAGLVIDAANQRLFAVNGGSSPAPSYDVSVFDIAPGTGMLTAIAGSPFPTGASTGRASAIAMAVMPRSACTDAAPGLCSPGNGKPSTDCIAEWLVSTTPPPPLNTKTSLPGTKVTCQNGNPGCDYDGNATDDHCTFHVQVCLNNADPRFSCTATDVASFDLKRPRPGGSRNDTWDTANITAFEAAISGASCSNEPQTRSCLTDADCVSPGTCTSPPVIGVPFMKGKTTLQPGSTSATPNNCSNVIEIQVPLRMTSRGQVAKSKSFALQARTSAKVSDRDVLTLKCVPGS